MVNHHEISVQVLRSLIRNKSIGFAGNRHLKIYGKLNCLSGKRMKKENRVFFKSETEALSEGYRPCAHCLNRNYRQWKNLT
jgi:methylphosphotriester-DNA--protein-cysteine methyltransferase